MPVSIATARDPFRGKGMGPTRRNKEGLRTPQARVLQTLMPDYPEDPPTEWPLLNRLNLSLRTGYTAISGTVTRALNGIHSDSSSGNPHPGILERGLVEEVRVDVDGVVEVNYRITTTGIREFQDYLAAGNRLPALRDAGACTNKRYRGKENNT